MPKVSRREDWMEKRANTVSFEEYYFAANYNFSMNNIEHDNGRLVKDLGHLNKQYQRLKNNHEKVIGKNKQLESRVEEQETIIEHMREIVFNDTSEDAG